MNMKQDQIIKKLLKKIEQKDKDIKQQNIIIEEQKNIINGLEIRSNEINELIIKIVDMSHEIFHFPVIKTKSKLEKDGK